jgi:hypothetical protein
MNTSMTLCLAEKVLVHSFETSELSSRTGSMVFILFHDQRSRSTSRLCASRVSPFLTWLLPERFYWEFMIYQRVSSHRLATMNCIDPSGFESFKTFLQHFLTECFHPKLTILRCMSSGINGRYVIRPSSLREFSTQCNLSHISPLECPVSVLQDLSPHGKILEANTWPNQVGATCHILTEFSILQMPKTF